MLGERGTRVTDEDRRLALGASDAGVVGMVEALDFDPVFQAGVAGAHNGSGNAAAVTVQIQGDPAMKSELQLRVDKGFVDAAGYATVAAKEIGPLYRDATGKLQLARAIAAEQPDIAKALRADAYKLLGEATDAERRYLGPVMKLAHEDAAYGLGVQYALFEATRAYKTASQTLFDAAFTKANENIRGVEPATITIGG
jgi:hypothetical protein